MSPSWMNHDRIDCHVHVFDPRRFPYAADAPFHPHGGEIATADYLGAMLDAYGIRHAVLVGPNSGYGFDNRCLLDAIARGAGRYRGIAVLKSSTSRDELAELKERGVIGAAFQVALQGTDHYADIGPLLERLRDFEMWADVQVQHDQLTILRPMLQGSGVKLLFDHCGRPDPLRGIDQPGFQCLLSLAETGRAFVKLSSLSKASAEPYPHQDAWRFVHALVETFSPRSLMWGSDWPFLRPNQRVDYGALLALFERVIPNAADRERIQWQTPFEVFDFGASA